MSKKIKQGVQLKIHSESERTVIVNFGKEVM